MVPPVCVFFFQLPPVFGRLDDFGLVVASGGQIMASCLRWHDYSWWGCCCSGEMCSLGGPCPNCSLRMWENKASCLNTRRCHSPPTGARWNTNFYHLPDSTSASSVKRQCGDIWGPRRYEFSSYLGGRPGLAGDSVSVCEF